jgi:hypothetical protein
MAVDAIQVYPEIEPYLDDTDSYEVTANETRIGDDRILVVTQRGLDGQQLYFKWNGEHFEFWDNDTIVDSATSILNLPPVSRSAGRWKPLPQGCGVARHPMMNTGWFTRQQCGRSGVSARLQVRTGAISPAYGQLGIS